VERSLGTEELWVFEDLLAYDLAGSRRSIRVCEMPRQACETPGHFHEQLRLDNLLDRRDARDRVWETWLFMRSAISCASMPDECLECES
jgi:hypothetical protein